MYEIRLQTVAEWHILSQRQLDITLQVGVWMTVLASRRSWKTLPNPVQRECFDLPLLFTDADGEQIIRGHIPKDMDDKWFIFFENGWLYFHRATTGSCIFGVRLDGSPLGVRVTSAWASRDTEHYRSIGVAEEKSLIEQLIRARLLSKINE